MTVALRGIPAFCLLPVIALLQALWPPLVLAQQPKAGVVTALRGQATVSRPVIPPPISLRFKDDAFLRDRIDTREDSIVRVGGECVSAGRQADQDPRV